MTTANPKPVYYHPHYEEMVRLRFEEKWTIQKIGDNFGLSRERVRQIIGNTKRPDSCADRVDRNRAAIMRLWIEGKNFRQISQETGVTLGGIKLLGLTRNYAPARHGTATEYNKGCRCWGKGIYIHCWEGPSSSRWGTSMFPMERGIMPCHKMKLFRASRSISCFG